MSALFDELVELALLDGAGVTHTAPPVDMRKPISLLKVNLRKPVNLRKRSTLAASDTKDPAFVTELRMSQVHGEPTGRPLVRYWRF